MAVQSSAALAPLQGPSYLEAQVVIEGTVRCQEALYINGRIIGNVHSEREIVIGTSGQVQGALQSGTLIVDGQVEGPVTVRHELEIMEHGSIRGELSVPFGGLIVHEGARLEGYCRPPVSPAEPTARST